MRGSGAMPTDLATPLPRCRSAASKVTIWKSLFPNSSLTMARALAVKLLLRLDPEMVTMDLIPRSLPQPPADRRYRPPVDAPGRRLRGPATRQTSAARRLRLHAVQPACSLPLLTLPRRPCSRGLLGTKRPAHRAARESRRFPLACGRDTLVAVSDSMIPAMLATQWSRNNSTTRERWRRVR